MVVRYVSERTDVSVLFSEPKIPQLSVRNWRVAIVPCFSALQRAENSSSPQGLQGRPANVQVSVLFSEPKIPQCPRGCGPRVAVEVSVLFSEPKIPQ